MKLISLPTEDLRAQDSDALQKVLLDRVLKIQKLRKEMKQDVHIQKAENQLELAKAPFKKAKTKWVNEMEAIEIELKSRSIRFNIRWDDIYDEEEAL